MIFSKMVIKRESINNIYDISCDITLDNLSKIIEFNIIDLIFYH